MPMENDLVGGRGIVHPIAPLFQKQGPQIDRADFAAVKLSCLKSCTHFKATVALVNGHWSHRKFMKIHKLFACKATV